MKLTVLNKTVQETVTVHVKCTAKLLYVMEENVTNVLQQSVRVTEEDVGKRIVVQEVHVMEVTVLLIQLHLQVALALVVSLQQQVVRPLGLDQHLPLDLQM